MVLLTLYGYVCLYIYIYIFVNGCYPQIIHSNRISLIVHYKQSLVGGLKHEFYFSFHIWDVILPIEELIFFNMVIAPPTRYGYVCMYVCMYIYIYMFG